MHSASRQWQPIWQCSLSPFRIFVTRVYTRASTYNHLYEDKTGRSHTVHVNGLLLIISVWTGWNVKMGVCWHRHFHTITFIGIFIYIYVYFFFSLWFIIYHVQWNRKFDNCLDRISMEYSRVIIFNFQIFPENIEILYINIFLVNVHSTIRT